MFVNDSNYYSLRQLTLGNIIDKGVCVKLLDKIWDYTYEALNNYQALVHWNVEKEIDFNDGDWFDVDLKS